MQYILALLTIPFLYSNYRILASDLKYKKIPNKYLGYLLYIIPFYYIYIFFSFHEINYLLFLLHIFLTFIVSFVLYFYGIWAAGNAKYLLILSLFIPYIGIVPFIGNIVLLAISYLILYFVWFYIGKCIFNKGYAINLAGNIKLDLSEKWKNYSLSKGGNALLIIMKWLTSFLIIFVSFRLLRIYVFNEIYTGDNNRILLIGGLIEKYNIYLLIGLIIIIIGFLFLIKKITYIIKINFSNKYNLNTNLIGNIFLVLIFILLISFIISEYYINSNEIIDHLYKIFTLYIALYLIFKLLIYSYKITFGVSQSYNIDIKKLNIGDIIDKKYLINLFGKQEVFKENIDKKGLLFSNPIQYLKDINNPIDQESIKQIKNIYKEVNIFHNGRKTDLYNNNIKISKAISFGSYIFFGFIISYLFGNKVFIFIIDFIIGYLKTYLMN